MLLVAVGDRDQAECTGFGREIGEIDLSGDIAQPGFFQRVVEALMVPIGQQGSIGPVRRKTIFSDLPIVDGQDHAPLHSRGDA